jgi:hypothetical protein
MWPRPRNVRGHRLLLVDSIDRMTQIAPAIGAGSRLLVNRTG